MLAGPGSEFSLANGEDFELDYYDYNVINAGAAPGSYLGMDPAYLVWIPPLDGANDIIQEMDNAAAAAANYADGIDANRDAEEEEDDEEPHYEEIRLPDSHTERSIHSIETASPSADPPPTLPPFNVPQEHQSQTLAQKNQRNSAISQMLAASALNGGGGCSSSICDRDRAIPLKELRKSCSSTSSSSAASNKCAAQQLTQQHNRRSVSSCASGGALQAIPTRQVSEEEEKETAVLKSPEPSNTTAAESSSSSARYASNDLDDIQFADDEEDADDGGQVVFVDNRSGTIRANAYYLPQAGKSTDV